MREKLWASKAAVRHLLHSGGSGLVERVDVIRRREASSEVSGERAGSEADQTGGLTEEHGGRGEDLRSRGGEGIVLQIGRLRCEVASCLRCLSALRSAADCCFSIDSLSYLLLLLLDSMPKPVLPAATWYCATALLRYCATALPAAGSAICY